MIDRPVVNWGPFIHLLINNSLFHEWFFNYRGSPLINGTLLINGASKLGFFPLIFGVCFLLGIFPLILGILWGILGLSGVNFLGIFWGIWDFLILFFKGCFFFPL